jgi:hypothetical protein
VGWLVPINKTPVGELLGCLLCKLVGILVGDTLGVSDGCTLSKVGSSLFGVGFSDL